MSCEKSLLVRGIPADWTADDIELFFDDDSRCPDGRVENAELATGEGTVSATVTFDNARGNYSAASYVTPKNFCTKIKQVRQLSELAYILTC